MSERKISLILPLLKFCFKDRVHEGGRSLEMIAGFWGQEPCHVKLRSCPGSHEANRGMSLIPVLDLAWIWCACVEGDWNVTSR